MGEHATPPAPLTLMPSSHHSTPPVLILIVYAFTARRGAHALRINSPTGPHLQFQATPTDAGRFLTRAARQAQTYFPFIAS